MCVETEAQQQQQQQQQQEVVVESQKTSVLALQAKTDLSAGEAHKAPVLQNK